MPDKPFRPKIYLETKDREEEKMPGELFNITSDIKISFERINIAVQTMLKDRESEVNRIIGNIIEKFDFETVLEKHIQSKINEGLEKAFSAIDPSDHFKTEIWKDIEGRILNLNSGQSGGK